MISGYQIGWEVECIIDDKYYSRALLTDKLREYHKDIIQSHEGSIEFEDSNNCYEEDFAVKMRRADYNSGRGIDRLFPTEIVTPHIPAAESLELLKKVFSLVNRIGYTNGTCGLHANISPIKTKDLEKINFLYLGFHPIFKEIVKYFKREENEFCSPNFWDKAQGNFWTQIIENMGEDAYGAMDVFHHKDAAINFGHLYDEGVGGCSPKKFTKSSRVEIRAFGNTNYHRKFAQIKSFTEKILQAFEDSKRYNFDYLK